MGNINLSDWDVTLYLRKSCHRYRVRATDENAAIKEAINFHNSERTTNRVYLTLFSLEDYTVERVIPHKVGGSSDTEVIE